MSNQETWEFNPGTMKQRTFDQRQVGTESAYMENQPGEFDI